LVKSGHNPDSKDGCGRTPLWHAAENGYKEVVEMLLGKIDSTNSDLLSPRPFNKC
jgi:hypothetical protein